MEIGNMRTRRPSPNLTRCVKIRCATGSWRVSVIDAESSVTVFTSTPRSNSDGAGTKHSITKAPPGASTRATLRKQSTWRAWLGRWNRPLHTRYTRPSDPAAPDAELEHPPGAVGQGSQELYGRSLVWPEGQVAVGPGPPVAHERGIIEVGHGTDQTRSPDPRSPRLSATLRIRIAR